MSDCSCIYISFHDCYPDFYSDEYRVARKEHKCTECGRIINKGEKYNYVAGKWEDEFNVFKTCNDCISLLSVFFCEGYNFGSIWDDFREHVNCCDAKIDSSYIVKLTPAARKKACNIIEKYWESLNRKKI